MNASPHGKEYALNRLTPILVACLLLAGCSSLEERLWEEQGFARVRVAAPQLVEPVPQIDHLDRAAEQVRRAVRRAGLAQPVPLIATNGLGLLVVDSKSDLALVWLDWTDEDSKAFQVRGRARWVSDEHVAVRESPDELRLLALREGVWLGLPPRLDEQSLTVLPTTKTWTYLAGERLYSGDSLHDIAVDATTEVPTPAPVASYATLDRVGLLAAERGGGGLELLDLVGGAWLADAPSLRLVWPYPFWGGGTLLVADVDGSVHELVARRNEEGALTWEVRAADPSLRIDLTVRESWIERGVRWPPFAGNVPPDGSLFHIALTRRTEQ